jgi:hypothetical protein
MAIATIRGLCPYCNREEKEGFMKLIFVSVALGMIVLTGCAPQTYVTRPDPVSGINIYTSDGAKIQGTWVYVIDDSVTSASRQIKASSHACSLHVYPVNAGESLATSVGNAMKQIFQNAAPRNTLPTINAASIEGLDGAVVVKLDEFYPKFNCSIGQFEGYCTASTDLSLTVTLITYPVGTRKYVHASAQRSADGGSGEMCAGVSNIISESVKKTTKDVLERVGEKISLINMLPQ